MPIFIFSVLTCGYMKRYEQVLVVGGAISHHGSIEGVCGIRPK